MVLDCLGALACKTAYHPVRVDRIVKPGFGPAMANAGLDGFMAEFLAIIIKQRKLALWLVQAAPEINQLPFRWTQWHDAPRLPGPFLDPKRSELPRSAFFGLLSSLFLLKYNFPFQNKDIMEPVDIPDPDAESGRNPKQGRSGQEAVRAIRLTSASAETAALGASAESGLADRARGFTTLVFMGALFVSAVWPAAIFAFLVALMGLQGILSLGPEWWVMIGAGALFPLPPIWIAVITWAKARDLSREARRLAQLADRLLEPDQTASHEIATVGMAIRREVESLSSGVEIALDKVRSLEGAVAAQAMAIDQAAGDAEARADQVRARMELERKALADITSSFKTQTEAHSRELEAQTQRVEDVTSSARSALEETARQLNRQGEAFTQAANAAVIGTEKVSGKLETQVEALNSLSDHTLATTDKLAGRYDEHAAALIAAAEGLGAENERLESTLAKQRELLGSVAELIARQNDQIATSLDDGSARLRSTLEDTVKQAQIAAAGFKSEIDAVAEGTGEVTEKIVDAARRASEFAKSAGADLSTEAARVQALVTEQTEVTKDVLGSLFDDFDVLYQNRAGELKELTASEIDALRSGLASAREEARVALTEQSEEAQTLITEATTAVTEAGDRLSAMFDKLLAASAVSNARFDATSTKVDEHMRTLPGLAEETASKIRGVLDEELNAFAKLADESARKIRTLNEAYGRHIPGLPRSAGFGEQRRPGILSEAAPLSLSGEPVRKGKWAWGEVLAAAERPFDKPSEVGAGEISMSGAPEDAKAFSKSSLEIFEALQSMAVDLDRALETDPPRDLLRRYLNGEKATFTQRLKEISSEDTSNKIHDKYLEDQDFRNHVNQYIEQFEGLLNEALSNDQEEIMIETFMSSTTGKVYFLLGGAIGHFG